MQLLQKLKTTDLSSRFKPKKKFKKQFLQGIKVQSMEGATILLTDLWEDKVVILKVLRRFGCPICRYESRLLSDLKPEFDKLNVRLVGIGFENVGLQEFVDGKYWEWELFIDLDKAVHRAVGLVKLPILQGLSDLMSNATRAAVTKLTKLGIPMNFEGDGFQLGGTFIIGPGNTGLLYKYRQTAAAIFPSLKQIFEVVGGDPNLVEDVAPDECLFYLESIYSKRTPSSQLSNSVHTKYRNNSISESIRISDKNSLEVKQTVSKDKSIHRPTSKLAEIVQVESTNEFVPGKQNIVKRRQAPSTKLPKFNVKENCYPTDNYCTSSETKKTVPSKPVATKSNTNLSLNTINTSSLHINFNELFEFNSIDSKGTSSLNIVNNGENENELEGFESDSTDSFYSTTSHL